MHPSLVGLDRGEVYALIDIPPAQHAIGASTYQQGSISTPGNREDRAVLSLKHPYEGSALRIPDEQLSLPAAASATGEPGAIWAPYDTIDRTPVPEQPQQHAA